MSGVEKNVGAVLTARSIQNGAYVELQGRWIQTQGRKQAHELHVDQVLHVGDSDPEVSKRKRNRWKHTDILPRSPLCKRRV